MKLIIVRHGETEGNVKKLVQGHQPGKLTKKGFEQAKKLANKLKQERIDVIFSSDLKRAKDTTKEIAKFHSVPTHYNSNLREKNMTIFEGKPAKEYYKAIDESGLPKHLYKPKGGESYVDITKRARKFFLKLLRDYKDKTVLIVSHGGFNRVLLGVLLKEKLENVVKIPQGNACINVVEIKSDSKYKIRIINSIKHLS